MPAIEYARVSSLDQDYDGQVERLKAAGCDRVLQSVARAKTPAGRMLGLGTPGFAGPLFKIATDLVRQRTGRLVIALTIPILT